MELGSGIEAVSLSDMGYPHDAKVPLYQLMTGHSVTLTACSCYALTALYCRSAVLLLRLAVRPSE